MFFLHCMLFPTFLEKNNHLLVKWEVCSPNSRYREFEHEVK